MSSQRTATARHICWLAQQAAEKAIKAGGWSSCRSISPRRTTWTCCGTSCRRGGASKTL
ncbi:MAG TPA: hypothetical protein VMZ50_06565 [Phycisphaerae bacterium]|nr:hypothetical protein [Phycisphaerae bacterium]